MHGRTKKKAFAIVPEAVFFINLQTMEQRNRCVFAAFLLALSFCLRAGGATVESNLSHRRFTTNDGLPQMQTETVWQDSRGYIYFGTLSGFVRYDGRTMTPFLGGRR